MKKTILFWIYGPAILFTWLSCASEAKRNTEHRTDPIAASPAPKPADSSSVLFDEIDKKLKLASFPTAQAFYRLYHFSGDMAYDTLFLLVPAGAIGSSLSRFEIHSPKGEVLYADTFHTSFFSRELLFGPDSIPAGITDYEQFRFTWVKSLTGRQIETYVKDQLGKFLETTSVDKEKDFKDLPDTDDGIIDKAEFQSVMADPALGMVWTPCFECDEGGAIIGFSKKQKKGIMIFGSD